MITSAQSILVVDDDPYSMLYTRSALWKMGFSNVYTAQTGREALHVVDQHKIDIIVADWYMPELSGVDMIRALRSRDHAQNIPVILVTAEDRDSMVREAFEARADGYIVKPFSFAKLMETVTRVLEQYDGDRRYRGSTEQTRSVF